MTMKLNFILFCLVIGLSLVSCGEDPDCTTLDLNIGDTCDDGDANTENDVVSGSCICAGTIIFECATLELNIGDDCDDGDTNTENDIVDADCTCVGTPIPEEITYTNTIKEIFDTSCAVNSSCHGAGSGIFELTNYEQSSAAAGFGRMIGAINNDAGFSAMPPNGKLDDALIASITEWINNDTPE